MSTAASGWSRGLCLTRGRRSRCPSRTETRRAGRCASSGPTLSEPQRVEAALEDFRPLREPQRLEERRGTQGLALQLRSQGAHAAGAQVREETPQDRLAEPDAAQLQDNRELREMHVIPRHNAPGIPD